MKYGIRKADIVLGIVLVILCAAVCWQVWTSGSGGAYAVVTVDGEEYGTYPLNEDREVDIDSEYGHNRLKISGGRVLMTEASCPDGYCLEQHRGSGGMKDSNETIVCLPNHVVVSISAEGGSSSGESGTHGAESDGPDAVVGAAGGRTDGLTGSGEKGGESGAADR